MEKIASLFATPVLDETGLKICHDIACFLTKKGFNIYVNDVILSKQIPDTTLVSTFKVKTESKVNIINTKVIKLRPVDYVEAANSNLIKWSLSRSSKAKPLALIANMVNNSSLVIIWPQYEDEKPHLYSLVAKHFSNKFNKQIYDLS